MLLRPLRARVVVHRRRPVASGSELRGQVAAQHRSTSRPVASSAQRAFVQEGFLPRDQARRGAQCCHRVLCEEKPGECAQEEAHGSFSTSHHHVVSRSRLRIVHPADLMHRHATQGYEVTHRDIELLKLRNYTVSSKINADLVTKDDVQQKLAEMIRGLSGFVSC